MFRVTQHPSSGVLKTVTAAPGTGHNIGPATSFQRGQVDLATLETMQTMQSKLHPNDIATFVRLHGSWNKFLAIDWRGLLIN